MRAVRAAAPIDEALAWLTHELELDVPELEALGEAIAYPTRSLSRTAIILARRLLDAAGTEEDRAPLTLELGARLSEVGRWEEARQVTEEAVETFRLLAELDRETYLPDLAAAVSNLGSCLAQLGAREEALNTTYEAVALHRELLERDRDQYLPSLARSLTNLSACLSRAGRRPAALGAAGQAVAIYRELIELHPHAYRSELAAADHNWRICREALGQPVAGRNRSTCNPSRRISRMATVLLLRHGRTVSNADGTLAGRTASRSRRHRYGTGDGGGGAAARGATAGRRHQSAEALSGHRRARARRGEPDAAARPSRMGSSSAGTATGRGSR